MLDAPASLALLAAAGAAAFLRSVGDSRARRSAASVVLLVVLSTVFTQALFYGGAPRTAMFAWGPVAIWREGIVHGLVQSMRLVGLGLLGTALAASTPPDRLVAGLVALGVPHGLAFLASAALRFVPTVAAEWQTAREARARRGAGRLRSPWSVLSREVSLLAPVAARAVRRSRTLAETLQARGFDPLVARRMRQPLSMGPHDRALLALVVVATLAVFSTEGLYQLYLRGLIYLPALRPLYGFARAWL